MEDKNKYPNGHGYDVNSSDASQCPFLNGEMNQAAGGGT
ncbi:MAG: catalase-peroxidase, partial [Flavobacteriaceae bacterium]